MLLSDAIGNYKADRLAKGYKPGTVRREQGVLRDFLSLVGNIQVNSLNVKHVDRLFYAKQDRWSARTFNTVRHTLSSFFKWCRSRGYMDRTNDPLEGTRNRKAPPINRVIIPTLEFQTVLDLAPTPRDRVVVAIGLYLFTRVSETSGIRWRDVDFDDDHRGTEDWKPKVTIYRVKTEDMDVLPMSEELYHELKRWRLAYAAAVGEVPKPGWYVTPAQTAPRFKGTSKGLVKVSDPCLIPTRRLSDVTKVVRKVLGKAGYLAKGEGGHTLRRSGAIALYHQLSSVGHDRAIRLCQAMLGHSSIQNTEIYLMLDLDRKARNDMLAGKPMFPGPAGATVFNLEGSFDGKTDARGVRL